MHDRHRPSGATIKRGPRVRITIRRADGSALLIKSTTLDLCGRCSKAVRFDHHRGTFGLWVHGFPDGEIEYLED